MSIKLREVLGSAGGSTPCRQYTIDPADANALFIGSPVKLEAGLVQPVVAADNEESEFIGYVIGLFSDTGFPVPTIPGTTAGTVIVADSPNQLIAIKLAAGSNLDEADIGKQYNFDFTIAGNAETGVNNVRLDDTAAAGAGDFHQVRLVGKSDSATWGENELEVIVTPSLHKYNSTPSAL